MKASMLNRLGKSLINPVDISSIVFFRIAFGAVMLWEVIRYFNHDWIESHWINPSFFFSYGGFHWVKPWADNGMYLHFFFLGVLAIFIMMGLFYRVASALFFLGFSFVYLLEKSYYLNHFYLIVLLSFIMMFIPANRAYSLDARLKPTIASGQVPAWNLWLLRFLIAIPYFFGGIAKINPDWLRGEPLRMWFAKRTDFPVIGPYFTDESVVYAFSYMGLMLDLLIVPFLLWKRTRVLAFLAITLFHLMNAWIWSIGIFPWFMIAATTIFFEPDWFRKVVDRLGVGKNYLPKMDVSAAMPKPSLFVKSVLVAFVVVQLYMPFRHFILPGNVHWNELGHRYSWHMKLRSKSGSGTFEVKDVVTKEKIKIDLKDYLSSRQRRKMRTHPDMILQFAHHLEKELKKEGYLDVEVRARIKASLNGREKQWLINPDVDLTQVTRRTPAQAWIMPLEEPKLIVKK